MPTKAYKFTLRQKKVIPCQRVQDNVVIVKVSRRRYRLARLSPAVSGEGFYNGYTNVRVFEFISNQFSPTEFPSRLKPHSEPSTYEIEI